MDIRDMLDSDDGHLKPDDDELQILDLPEVRWIPY